MQKMRVIILHGLSLLFIFTSVKCADPSGAGLNAAACSPINGLSQETTIDAGGYEGPVALPVTIAKELEGFDATTIYFQEAARDQMIVRATEEGTTITRADETIIGTIYGYPADLTTCHTGVAFIDNARIATMDPINADCLLGLTVTEDQIDEFVALAICSPSSCNSTSLPVVVQIIDSGAVDTGGVVTADDYTLQVIITNTSVDANDPDSNLDISNTRVAFMTVDGEEAVAFAASETDRAGEEYVVATVQLQGGTLTEIASLSTEPSVFYDNPDGSIVFLGSDNVLHSLDESGVVGDIDLNDLFYAESGLTAGSAQAAYKIHPSGHHVIYFDDDKKFHMKDLITGDTEGPYNFSNLDQIDAEAIFFDFSMTGDIVAAHRTVDDQYIMLQFNPFDAVLSDGSWDVEADVIVPLSDRIIHSPAVDNFNYVYFQCDAGSLCRLDLDVDEPEIEDIDVGNFIRNFELARDGRSFIVLDLTVTREPDREDFQRYAVALLPIDENGDPVLPPMILYFGNNGTPGRENTQIIAYNYRVNGTNQIGIVNLGRRLQANELPFTVTPETSYVPLGSFRIITAMGGMPPYELSIESGSGILTTATGRFQPIQAGIATVRVTDYFDHTAVSTIITGGSGTLFNQVGDEGIIKLTGPDATAMDVRFTGQKIIATGYTDDNEAVVARFLSTGEVDPDFDDGDGYLTFNSGETRTHALKVQDNGNLVVGGYASPGIDKQFMLACIEPDGQFNDLFGDAGIVLTDFGANRHDVINDIAINPDTGKIYAAGYTDTVAEKDNFALARYSAFGVLDENFGTGGLKTFDIGLGQNDRIEAIALQDDGKIIAVGRARLGGNNHAIIMRLNLSGSRDFAFGTNGIVDLNFSTQDDRAVDVRVTDNDIIVLGTTDNVVTGYTDTFIVKLNIDDGSTRVEFSSDGIVSLGRTNADLVGASLVVQSDGKIDVGGYLGEPPITRWMVARLDADGELDDTFDTDGYFFYSEGSAPEVINSVFFGQDGFIYAAGQGVDGSDLPLAIGVIWP